MTSRLPSPEPPKPPGWFRSEPEPDGIEFESVDVADETAAAPNVHISAQWAQSKSFPSVESEPDPDVTSKPTTELRWSGVRVRDVMLGVAAASFLFGVFSIGFLSRGLVTPAQDPQLLTLLERAVETRSQIPAPLASPFPAIAPVVAQPVETVAEVEPATQTPNANTPPTVFAAADTKQVARAKPVPQQKLNESFTHSFARPIGGTLKIATGQTASLNLATAAASGDQTQQCESGKCDLPPAGPVQGEHGTKIAWAESPDEARQLAVAQNKLVFMMHVSGNFEKPGFT